MNRKALIARARARLQQTGAPRLEMSLIMLLTGGAGFMASFSFLHLGLVDMSIRYPLAVLVAYAAFLLYLWLWLGYRRRKMEAAAETKPARGTEAPDGDLSEFQAEDRRRREGTDAPRTRRKIEWGDVSTPDFGVDLPLPSFGSGATSGGGMTGGGGSFGGGGASDRFDAPVAASFFGDSPGEGLTPAAGSDAGSGIGDFFSDLDVDDDFGKVFLLLLVVVVILFLTGYVIYIAPGLLAEVLVDGVLVTGLYRHLKKEDRRYWLATALRKTWWYFLLVAALLLVAGVLMQSWYPEARSIGDVWEAFNTGG